MNVSLTDNSMQRTVLRAADAERWTSMRGSNRYELRTLLHVFEIIYRT